MKNSLIIIAAVFFTSSFVSCNQKELAEANRQKDSLQVIVDQRDSSLNDFIGSFNDVERNLDSIAIRQHIISLTTDQKGELKPNQKAHINAQIEAINELMDQNRKKLAELNRKLKSSSRKNVELEKAIATINSQLAQKDLELTALNEKLNSLNAQVVQLQTSVDTLTVINSEQSQRIAEETMALHTAYYVIGKSKDLEDAKLIDRKGGLLGIGKTSKVRGDLDNSKFTKIDFTQTTTIQVNSEMKMITNHPSDSYVYERDEKNKDVVKNIVISNPEKFWSTSKYLVIVKS